MTFLEACNSGKKFRRPCFGKNHYWWVEDGQVVTNNIISGGIIYVFEPTSSIEEDGEMLVEFFAEDWELEG